MQIAKENEKLLHVAWEGSGEVRGDVVGIYEQVGVDFSSIVEGEEARTPCHIPGMVLIGTARAG